jgi:hypothetical protein
MCKFYKIESKVNLTFPTNDLRFTRVGWCVGSMLMGNTILIIVVVNFLDMFDYLFYKNIYIIVILLYY